MSIKGFHLIFITIAALFCLGFSVWAFFFNDRDTSLATTIAGAVTFIASILLVVYGVYFRRKSKNIIV
jgi:hypothetical protein